MTFRRIATGVVIVFTVLMALGNFRVQAQSNAKPIQYGDTVTDTIDATNTSRFYSFNGTQGDLVTVTAVRNSGNLIPVVGIVDPALPKDSMVLTAGNSSTDGKTSTITDFELSKTTKYYVEVIGDKSTTGKFTVTLDSSNNGSSSSSSGNSGGNSNAKPIQYGDTVTDTIDVTNTSRFYAFDGTQGDSVSATAIRKTGNLNPIVGIVDPSLPKDSMVLIAGDASADGKTSTITDFELPKTGKYLVEVIGDKSTKGMFTLTLDSSNGSSSGSEDTPVPTDENNSGDQNTPVPTHVSNGGDNSSSDSIIDDFEVGNKPAGVVWSGDNLFVVNYQDGTVSVLDSDGNVTDTIKVGGNPMAAAWDGSRLWVTDTGTDDKPENAVTVYNPDGSKVGKYIVGREPFSLSYDPDEGLMWVAVYADKKVVGVDSDGKVQATIKTTSNPNTVLYAPKSVVFVTLSGTADSPSNSIMVIDASKGSSMGTKDVGKSPADLAWDATSETLYVANHDDNTVSQFDIKNSKNNLFKTGKSPAALAWDGSHIWVALDSDKAVVALDPSDGSELAHVKLKNAPYSMTSDGSGHVWVTQLGDDKTVGNTVSRINIDAAIGQQ